MRNPISRKQYEKANKSLETETDPRERDKAITTIVSWKLNEGLNYRPPRRDPEKKVDLFELLYKK